MNTAHQVLTVKHLSAGYGKKQVLFDVSFDVTAGELVLVSGGNGSGKSTLLKAVFGLLPPWDERARVSFQPRPGMPPVPTTPVAENLSRGLAYLPQKNGVFDDLTVDENLQVSYGVHRDHKNTRAETLEAFPKLGPLLRRLAGKLSGGERQMLALGMVLFHKPHLLLLDEPTAGLSEDAAQTILGRLATLRASHGFSVLLVEHRLHVANIVADRHISLTLGRLGGTNDPVI